MLTLTYQRCRDYESRNDWLEHKVKEMTRTKNHELDVRPTKRARKDGSPSNDAQATVPESTEDSDDLKSYGAHFACMFHLYAITDKQTCKGVRPGQLKDICTLSRETEFAESERFLSIQMRRRGALEDLVLVLPRKYHEEVGQEWVIKDVRASWILSPPSHHHIVCSCKGPLVAFRRNGCIPFHTGSPCEDISPSSPLAARSPTSQHC